jgi:NNP family nitrate/nitrite transporter-like MFS transporter
MVSYQTFFLVIAATAVLGFLTLLFMKEPKGSITEINEDGSVQLIQVN